MPESSGWQLVLQPTDLSLPTLDVVVHAARAVRSVSQGPAPCPAWTKNTCKSFSVSGHRVAAAAATGLGGSLCANGPDVVKAPPVESC